MLHISHALDTVFLFSTIYMCIYEFLQLETIIIMCSCWFTNLLYGLPCKSLSLRRDSVPFAYNAICLFFDCHFARLWISVLLPCVCVHFFIRLCFSSFFLFYFFPFAENSPCVFFVDLIMAYFICSSFICSPRKWHNFISWVFFAFILSSCNFFRDEAIRLLWVQNDLFYLCDYC